MKKETVIFDRDKCMLQRRRDRTDAGGKLVRSRGARIRRPRHDDAPDGRQQLGQHAIDIFIPHGAEDERGPGSAERSKVGRKCRRAGRIVRRIQDQLAAVGQRPVLEPSRPRDIRQAVDDGRRADRHAETLERFEHAHRDPGVAGLMGSAKAEANRTVLACAPVGSDQRRAALARDVFDHGQRFRRDVADHDRDARLDDAGLLRGDRVQRIAEILLVIEVDRRDGCDHAELHAGTAEQVEGHRGVGFEECRRRADRPVGNRGFNRALDLSGGPSHVGRADGPSVDHEALGEIDQMRGRETRRRVARGPQHSVDHRRHGSFAVGAGDVDRSKRALRIAEAREQRADVVESELDAELLEAEKVGERVQ